MQVTSFGSKLVCMRFAILLLYLVLAGCQGPSSSQIISRTTSDNVIVAASTSLHRMEEQQQVIYLDLLDKVSEEIQEISFGSWKEYNLFLFNRFRMERDFGEGSAVSQHAYKFFIGVGEVARQKGYGPHVLRRMLPAMVRGVVSL